MNLFVIMMLLNMALVWLMMYFSICLMIIVLKWYFEITIIPSKMDCADRPFEIIFFSISGQHNLWKQFVMLYVLIWYMTIVCKWGGKIFVHRIIFVKRIGNILLTKILHFLLFSYTAFYARLGPYPCVEIKFLKKGDGLLCQILIILQC